MEHALHHRQKTVASGTPAGEIAEETPMRARNFWRKRTVDELAAEQGIAVPQQLDEMIGAAAELWHDDRDFDRFVQAIHDARLEGLDLLPAS